MTSQRLTIYLLQEISDADEAIAMGKTPTKVPVSDQGGLSGNFYYVTKPPKTPGWVQFVRGVAPTLPDVFSSSASGLLVAKAHDRYFALTFGYGRSLLDLSKIERQFGLRVALNRIDPTQLRSMDTKTFEDLVVNRTTQTSKKTDIPTFGIDISSDILRAVTGEPRDPSLSKRLSGADALVLGTTKNAADLPEMLGDILAAFSEDSYKDNFSWIDHLALVTDSSLIDLLDERLADQLVGGDTSITHMAMPETINWEDIEAFKIAGSKELFEDLDIDEYLGALSTPRSEITVKKLKGRQVTVKFLRSGQSDERCTLYNCLISEQRVNDQLYVLIEGKWLAISDSLAEEVDAFAGRLPSSAVTLINSTAGESEYVYNQRLAASQAGKLINLDKKIKVPGGASSGIEVCDVLSSAGEFIHIQRKSRSSTLSHLFAQGSVSATTFLSDGTFRDKIRTEIENTVAPGQRDQWLELVPDASSPVDRSKYAVSYGVIANSDKQGADWLPFFSKLNLMQQGKQILSMGFQLSVSRISIDAQASAEGAT
ncbi:DUF6119 family protein [Mycobacterium interjectum]|uniref:DUF6119 family protein n=1 Tax=Mycobacterium interjectum TaxID=33895 RepID=UPI000ADFAEFF|nr:DUF6119 family protein [Mycobacterium interjectum]MCV7091649.1 TIGR04141 family sporadically distributed protein [Mycobacterium interjectum]